MNVRRSQGVLAVAMTVLAGALLVTPATTAAVTAQATGLRDLGTLGGRESNSVDINAWGHVTGTADTADGNSRAYLWTPSDGMRARSTI
ncbi:hypothetical protein ACLQ2Q_11620 [Microbacterium sp. DT81.1]|uniref:hypothetical protein n=1 Tax=Microbacterium sp. DT81.1 TaxID=3393413 RepID=UPI003CF13CFF